MKKEKRKMSVDGEAGSNESFDAVGVKIKKKKRKVDPVELDSSKPADISRVKPRKKSTPNNAVGETDVISTKNVKRKHRGDHETEDTNNSDLRAEKTKKKSKKHATVAVPSSEEKKKVSPSEAAAKRKMKQKKRAKKAAKKAKKLEEKTSTGAAPSEADAKAESLALEYLRLWHGSRDEWSFQKVRQVWLLQHLYDTDKVGTFPDTWVTLGRASAFPIMYCRIHHVTVP